MKVDTITTACNWRAYLFALSIFVESDETVVRERFRRFYSWKGQAAKDIDGLWESRMHDDDMMKAAFADGQRIVDFDQARRVYLLAR